MRWGCLVLVGLAVIALVAFTYGGPLARFVGQAKKVSDVDRRIEAELPRPPGEGASRDASGAVGPPDRQGAADEGDLHVLHGEDGPVVRLGERRWTWRELEDADRALDFQEAFRAAAQEGDLAIRIAPPRPARAADAAQMRGILERLEELGVSSLAFETTLPSLEEFVSPGPAR